MNFSTNRRFSLRATRCRITSVSVVDWQMAPFLISQSRKVSALVRLPLWASAKPPESRSTKSGCTLRMIGSPQVE